VKNGRASRMRPALVNCHVRPSAHPLLLLLPGRPALPVELVQAARRLELPALALTDHNRLSGAIEFYDACREAGVQPLLGMELDVIPPGDFSAFTRSSSNQLVLLAQDMQGWASLCRLASAAQADPSNASPLSFEQVAASSERPAVPYGRPARPGAGFDR